MLILSRPIQVEILEMSAILILNKLVKLRLIIERYPYRVGICVPIILFLQRATSNRINEARLGYD